jgi:hypothetical protein
METKFNEYADAAGTPQLDCGTGITRVTAPSSEGGPNGPVFPDPDAPPRVSTRRHGVMAMNVSPVPPAVPVLAAAGLRRAQFFSAIPSG